MIEMTEINTKIKRKKGRIACKICGDRTSAVMKRYNLNICRRCFKEMAEKIGFKKYN